MFGPAFGLIGSFPDSKLSNKIIHKDWHSAVFGAVVSANPGAEGVPRSCPAGLAAEVGLRWCGATPRTERRISMSKSVKKRSPWAARLEATAATPSPQPMPKSNRTDKAEASSKQSRVVAMLQSPAGATIAAMTEATGWQPHSVRGFLAGVVRKRLKLQLASTKVDGTRVYRIIAAGSSKPGRKSKRLSA
jgi:uncharacterized protein DUF3489